MRIFLLTMALALAACSPPASTSTSAAGESPAPSATEAAANNCPASAQASWNAGDQSFAVEASARGADCPSAQATIVIRAAGGAQVYTATIEAARTRALAEAESVSDMERRLREWITPAGASMDSSGDLIPWEEGQPEPGYGEAAFHPAAGVTRDVCEALRAADAPLYCYEQNMESGVCLAVREGELGVIGEQTYAQ